MQLPDAFRRIALERAIYAHEYFLGNVLRRGFTDYAHGHPIHELLVVDDQIGKRLIEILGETRTERVMGGDCHVHAGITQPAPNRLQIAAP